MGLAVAGVERLVATAVAAVLVAKQAQLVVDASPQNFRVLPHVAPGSAAAWMLPVLAAAAVGIGCYSLREDWPCH